MDWLCFCWPWKKEPFVADGFRRTSESSDMPLTSILKGMSKGTVMYKVRAPDRWYRRKYKVDVKNLRLSYFPTNKPFWRTKITSVDLYDLEEVRKGWNTDVFNSLEAKFRRHLQARFHPQLRNMLKEENCFSLIVAPTHAVLDLIAPNVYTREAWVRGLNQLIASCKSSRKKHEYDRFLKEQVIAADVSQNGCLNFEECLRLLNQLNISMSIQDARKLFDQCNYNKAKIDGEDALEPDEFVHFYHKLDYRPELEDIMKRYSVSESTIWSTEELQNFLQKEQKQMLTLEDCQIMIDKYEPSTDKIEGYLTLTGFREMMLSLEENIFNKKHRLIYQDMSQPLSHYYIASSHNTYLLQGQLIGESSIEGYIQALMRGCRCLELDIWDGSNDEPVVYHGYTLTSRVLFRDILDAIKQYAFRASQYPVILSLENHCSISQQVKMAHHFNTILGDYLYKDPIGENETQFPSPEALARKIILKGKKIRLEPMSSEDILLEEEEERKENEIAFEAAMAATNVEGEAKNEAEKLLAAADSIVKGIAQELSDLVNYCAARRFHSFEDCKNSWCFYEMASFQETKALEYGSTKGTEFVDYNKRHFARIYPKGTRTDSSNYDPIPYWNAGCQLVALNYQTWDKHMHVNEAKFAQNGRCGYVLKPKYFRDHNVSLDPSQCPEESCERHVKIKVISGQCLPKPFQSLKGEVVDPYVIVKVTGHPLDEQKKKTEFINDNGFNPVWNETFEFVLKAPEQAIFVFRVRDRESMGKDHMLGQYALPFTSITEGYRHIHLVDENGQSLLPATLFVHVEISK